MFVGLNDSVSSDPSSAGPNRQDLSFVELASMRERSLPKSDRDASLHRAGVQSPRRLRDPIVARHIDDDVTDNDAAHECRYDVDVLGSRTKAA